MLKELYTRLSEMGPGTVTLCVVAAAMLLFIVGGAATSAIGLLDYAAQTQDPMRKGLVQKITNESVYLKRINFIPIDGFTYRYNRQDTLGGIAFRALNANYTADQGIVNPYIESVAIFGGQINTDRQIVNKQGDIVRANAISAKARKAGLFFDKYVIDGDPTTDPLSFYGLNARLTGNQVIAMGANGATLTLDALDQLRDAVVGTNDQKVLTMNKAMRRKVSKLIYTAAGGAATKDVGHQADNYDGTPIDVIDEDGDEAAILGFDETQGSSNVCCSIYCQRFGSDTEGEYMQGLVGGVMIPDGTGEMTMVPNIEHVDVGLLGTYYADLLEANMGLAIFHGRSAARLKGITNT